MLRSGEALAVLEVDGAAPARTVELARTVAARLDPGGDRPARRRRPRPPPSHRWRCAGRPAVGLRRAESDLYGRELDGNPSRDACGRLLAGDTRRRAARQLVLAGSGRRVHR